MFFHLQCKIVADRTISSQQMVQRSSTAKSVIVNSFVDILCDGDINKHISARFM